MKLVCISEFRERKSVKEWFSLFITKGKIYTISGDHYIDQEFDNNDKFYIIVDNNGDVNALHNSLFMRIEEYREMQLKELGI
jgi:hypothetical protein